MPRIALVDDDESVRRTLRSQFDHDDLGIVGEAADGFEAIEVVLALKPDVVLMDVRMPGMNGFEATRQIKHQLPFTQVIFVTVYDEPHPSRSAEETGAYAYLLKDSSQSSCATSSSARPRPSSRSANCERPRN